MSAGQEGFSLAGALSGATTIIVAAVTAAGTWLAARSTAAFHYAQLRRQQSVDRQRLVLQDRTAAFGEMKDLVVALRRDVDDLRKELAEERTLWRQAERSVRSLQAEVSALREVLQRAGVPLPPAEYYLRKIFSAPEHHRPNYAACP
jgi:hypothetical protein